MDESSDVPQVVGVIEVRVHPEDRATLQRVERMVGEVMAGIDDLRAGIADLQTQVTAENDALGQLASDLQAAEATISQLQAAGAGAVSDADLESLATQVGAISQSAAAATAAATAAPAAPAAGGTAAPAGTDVGAGTSTDTGASGTAPAAPVDTSGTDTSGTAAPTDGTATDTSGSTDAPAGGTVDPTDPTATGDSSTATDRTVYTFGGDASTVDPQTWPTAPVVTDTGAPLYYFSGDTAAGQQNGAGLAGLWQVYTGATQPATAAAAPDAGTTPAAGES